MAAAAILAAGCGGPGTEKPADPKAGQPGPAAEYAPDADKSASAAGPGAKATPEQGSDKKEEPKLPGADFKTPERNYVIRRPGQGSWTPPTQASTALTPAALGTRMDQAIAKLSNTLVDGRITFDATEGELQGKVEFKIESPDRFRVEYLIPSMEGAKGIMVGDGARRASSTEDGWEELEPKGGPLSPTQINDWGRYFPRIMLSSFATKQSVWGPLFSAWGADKGAKTTLETQNRKDDGKERPFYRVTSIGPKGEFEVVVDGTDLLPLTVRSRVKHQGKENKIMWTGRWAFGGTHEAKSFLLPQDLK